MPGHYVLRSTRVPVVSDLSKKPVKFHELGGLET